MFYKILNQTKKVTLAEKAEKADSFFSRGFGLMFKKGLSKEGALIFYDASSIHTCFMRFCLDLLFLDEDKKVIRIVKGLKPWRAVFCRKSKITIEFSSKNENLKNTTDGDYIDII